MQSRMISPDRPRREIEIWFADEARIGREEQDHPQVGQARYSPKRSAGSAHRLDLHLRSHLPEAGKGRGSDPPGLQHRSDEPASGRNRQGSRTRLSMLSSSSIKPDGICQQDCSFPPTSPLCHCRRSALNSIRSKISGNICATTGSRTASSNPTTISSITAAMPGIRSSTAPGKSCPSDYACGHMGSDQ